MTDSAAPMSTDRPLSGIRVLDFTHAAAGPFTTMWLADLGAEVLKIEKPGRGDGARFMGEPLSAPEESDYYVALNKSKESVLIDLSSDEGRRVATDFARHCDIVVQNFRPGVMDRLGLGFQDLSSVRPALVYCSISAFADDGPWADRPANDIIMQGISGLMSITGEEGRAPVRIGSPISDFSTGLFGLSAVLAALFMRDRRPEGQHVRLSMFDCTAAMLCNFIPSAITMGKPVPRFGRGHPQIVPYQSFECGDGNGLIVGAFTAGFWRSLCRALDREEWITNPLFESNSARLAHRDELVGELEAIFCSRPREHWQTLLDAADVPNAPVLSVIEALTSEEAQYAGTVTTVAREDGSAQAAVIGNPFHTEAWSPVEDRYPPRMGEHTVGLLKTLLGYSDDQVTELLRDGAVAAKTQEGER
jgi:crotonobetainyl-CoA:carnitine CoA-transferase CaiB-like acyl-CoA transferase